MVLSRRFSEHFLVLSHALTKMPQPILDFSHHRYHVPVCSPL
jgi:hypothetical protein